MSEKRMGEMPVGSQELEKKSVRFYVAEEGLSTSISEVVSDKEFFDRDAENFEPNQHWESITVANEEDKNRWIQLRNEWLNCAWSPNQDSQTRDENRDRMQAIKREMGELESKVIEEKPKQ